MDMERPGFFHDEAVRSVDDATGGDEEMKGRIMGGNMEVFLGEKVVERLRGGRGGKI